MPERTLEHCHYTIIAPEGPGRVTPHPILGWDCGRAGMPTARSTAHSTGTIYRTWSYLRYVSHISVWSNTSAISVGGLDSARLTKLSARPLPSLLYTPIPILPEQALEP